MIRRSQPSFEQSALHSPTVRGSVFYLGLFSVLGGWLPFISVYFRNIGLSGWEIGLLSGLLPAATFLLAPPLTALADRRGTQLGMLTLSLLGLGGALALFLFFSSRFWILTVLMVLLAIFYSPVTPLADGAIAGMALRHRSNYGGMRLWGSLGYAVMAIVGGVLWQRLGYATMFIVCALLYFAVAGAVRSLESIPFVEHHQRVPLKTVLSDRAVIVILLSALVVGAAIGIDLTFTGVYMQHLGGGGLYVGLAFGIAALFELPTMRYSTHLARWIGGWQCLLVAQGLFATAYVGYVLSPSPAVMVGFSIFRGLAYGLFYASTVRLLSEGVPKEWASTVQGIMNGLAFGLGQLLSRPAGGIIYDTLGPSMVFVAGTGLVVVAAAIVLGAAAKDTLAPSGVSTPS